MAKNKQYRLDTITPLARLTTLQDIERCAVTHLPLTQCAGGRIIVDGFICPHCGSIKPKVECHAPHVKL